MKREFAIRFEPRGGGHAVPGRAYIDSLNHVYEGLSALREKMIPALSGWYQTDKKHLRSLLQIQFLPSEKGSLEQLVDFGGSEIPTILDASAKAAFWIVGSRALGRASRGIDSPFMATKVAEPFASAAEAAHKQGVSVSLSERRRINGITSNWRTLFDITKNKSGLHAYVQRRGEPTMRSNFTLLGEMINVSFHPHFFKLLVDGMTIHVETDAEKTKIAHSLMGQRVAVTLLGRTSEEKRPSRDSKVLSIEKIAGGSGALARLRAFRGTMQDLWGTEEAQQYLESLRRQGE